MFCMCGWCFLSLCSSEHHLQFLVLIGQPLLCLAFIPRSICFFCSYFPPFSLVLFLCDIYVLLFITYVNIIVCLAHLYVWPPLKFSSRNPAYLPFDLHSVFVSYALEVFKRLFYGKKLETGMDQK